MKTHCDICRYQGEWRETVEEIEGVAVCHDHRLDIREQKLGSSLWREVRIVLKLDKIVIPPPTSVATAQRELPIEIVKPAPKFTNSFGRKRMAPRTVNIVNALLRGVKILDIAAEYSVTRAYVYSLRTRYCPDIPRDERQVSDAQ